MSSRFGITEVATGLTARLREYLEAQYHIRNESLVRERNNLLLEEGCISQAPFVELTPQYEFGKPYDQYPFDPIIRDFFAKLALLDVGVFARPYVHQVTAMTEFLIEKNDIVVSTGTGSGKTECFLFNILAKLAEEGSSRPNTYSKHAVRALILYPMNALVSDQLARIRRLLGDNRVKQQFTKTFGRHPLFAMYTSRTPYAGQRTAKRDSEVGRIVKYYLDLEEKDPSLHKDLTRLGRVPAKDLRGFYGSETSKWDKRLHRTSFDAELLTRHEIHEDPPDILITNYSMLEYMLLRPIERRIFQETKQWLASDPKNEFILVLDEAHMYRGAGGAEVALLIRRLRSRLELDRRRLRCILTSASMGEGPDASQVAKRFAEDLTGALKGSGRAFSYIEGVLEKRTATTSIRKGDVEALASFPLDKFLNRHDGGKARQTALNLVNSLAKHLHWSECDTGVDEAGLVEYLYTSLDGYEPAERIISKTSGNAMAFSQLAEEIFPGYPGEVSRSALENLLSLTTCARKTVKGRGERVLTPSRVHLFFRGLPPIFACINPRCDKRREDPGADLLLGRMYDGPQDNCTCAGSGRVFELITHRDCGAAFIRAYVTGLDGEFLWHEQGGQVGDDSKPFVPTYFLIDKPHDDADNISRIWIHIATGRFYRTRPSGKSEDFLLAYEPIDANGDSLGPDGIRFEKCPVCRQPHRDKIMDLSTKGEQPFANLVRELFSSQPPQRPADKQHPNSGRKVLLFSDGRQKAARLARDLPREVERDTFRQAIMLAAKRCHSLKWQARPYTELYWSFVEVCSTFNLQFFDQADGSFRKLREHIHTLQHLYEKSLQDAVGGENVDPPGRYKMALLLQLGHPYYSLHDLCCAIVTPVERLERLCTRKLSSAGFGLSDDVALELMRMWLRAHLKNSSFDPQLTWGVRHQANHYARGIGINYVPENLRRVLRKRFDLKKNRQNDFSEALAEEFCGESRDRERFIEPTRLKLIPAIGLTWYLCRTCSHAQPSNSASVCWRCGSQLVDALTGKSDYLRARKSFWISPIEAALNGTLRPYHLTAEEHTAQLSHRDPGEVLATTEKFELRFQDVTLDEYEPPVDILSCTTTMEVGIDIGSLQAIGMRNVPPQRENYQQRAGRAGRRSSAVSVVATFCPGGPHDMYYYGDPQKLISGPPRKPRVKIDNAQLARRHVNSYILQTYFHSELDRNPGPPGQSNHLSKTLGEARAFLEGTTGLCVPALHTWVDKHILVDGDFFRRAIDWLPNELFPEVPNLTQSKTDFIRDAASTFVQDLEEIGRTLPPLEEDHDSKEGLLDVLFTRGVLPTYAFPTDLCSFYIFERDKTRRSKVTVKEKPEQSREKALSEYAPGRTLVVNKKTYRVGGIYVHFPKDRANRAAELFQNPLPEHVYCERCGYVSDADCADDDDMHCPICQSDLFHSPLLVPPAFSPERGEELREEDLDQELSSATSAQFPMPLQPTTDSWGEKVGVGMFSRPMQNQSLVATNRGPGGHGFYVCTSCGATKPGNLGDLDSGHPRPFLLDQWDLRSIGSTCSGSSVNVLLGHTFRTDLVVIRVALPADIDCRPDKLWVRDAFRTLSEAILLSGTRVLDIDASEMNSGFRFLPQTVAQERGYAGLAEIYLYDTLSGGAGYSALIGERLPDILNDCIDLLETCRSESCIQSCPKCLRHYGNRFWQPQLDRQLGLDLLRVAYEGVIPKPTDIEKQAEELRPLAEYLRLQDVQCSNLSEIDGVRCPLTVVGGTGRRFAIGTHPAIANERRLSHQLHAFDDRDDVSAKILNAYIVRRDLPTAARIVLEAAGLTP